MTDMKLSVMFAGLLTFALAFTGCTTTSVTPTAATVPVAAKLNPSDYVLKVSATCQDYSFGVPWRKLRPYSTNGMGVLINGGHVLVPAEILRNHTFIELEKVDSGVKTTAELTHIDYGANLALVAPEDKTFLAGMKSLEVIDKVMIGDEAEAWQFEVNGSPLVSKGSLYRVETGFSLLDYRFDIELPGYLSTPRGMPVISKGKLAGVTKSYTSNSNSLYAIPAQIINHFLRDMKEGEYQGFPSAGFGYTLLNDPELRKFIGLPEGKEGVYVTYIRPKSPAAEAGLRKGDVVLGVDEFDLNRKAQYDDPDYGDLHFYHLINTKSFSGTVRVFKIWRDRKEILVNVTLKFLPQSTYPVPKFIYDRGPEYMVVGGFVMQELSRQYLRSWNDWQDNAPQRLVYYERNQWELAEPGYKPVIIGLILPAAGNTDYEQFSFKRVDTINGKKITCLADVKEALKSPVAKNEKKFHHFTFFYPPREVVLDVEQAKKDDEFLRERFQIPALERFYN